MNRALAVALVALASGCASAPRAATMPAPAPVQTAASEPDLNPESLTPAQVLPAWRALPPDGRARFEAALLARIRQETATRATPSSGPISTSAPDRAWAIFDALPPETRAIFARSILAWLIERAWGMSHARALIEGSVSAIGQSAYDTIAEACDEREPPSGCPSMMLYTDAAGHDALLARLLPRARGAFEALRAPPAETVAGPQAPRLQRLDALLRLLWALERPEPTQRLLLEVVADASHAPRLRTFALERLYRSDLAPVAPALLAVANRAGDVVVRAAVVTLLGQMIDRVPLARFDEIYERTAATPEDAAVRAALGVVYLRRQRSEALRKLVAWMRRPDVRRAGFVEADAWAHELAREHPRDLQAILAQREPQARALAILAWSWSPSVGPERVEALTSDRARLDGASWRERDTPTVGALAAWALTHRERDPMIRLDGCCV